MQTSKSEGLAQAAAVLQAAWASRPTAAIVLGSGLGHLADAFEEATVVPYARVPGMPEAAVAGHQGRFVCGRCQGRPVIAMQGRVHLYEGHPLERVVFGVRLMLHLGARVLLLTNAAGGIGDHLRPGDLMLIRDHLNLTGRNCLVGPNDDALGPRFPDMSEVYSPSLRELAQRCARAGGEALAEGVYAGLLGPSYETPAEIRMLKLLGADAVGMSTVQEAIAARHMGADCLGISCITNLAAGLSEDRLDHGDVQATAQQAAARFTDLMRAIIGQLD